MSAADRDMLLAELVDGELAPDDANQLLQEILDSAEAQGQLRAQLQLRAASAAWRRHAGTSTMTRVRWRESSWLTRHGLQLAAAVLVIGFSFWMLQPHTPNVNVSGEGPAHAPPPLAAISTADAARVLAAHESVAGPVGWLAVTADDVQVHNLPVGPAEGPAVACYLNIHRLRGRTFPEAPQLIICRLDRKAVLSLPANNASGESLHIELVPTQRGAEFGVLYAVTLDGRGPSLPSTTLTGFIPASDSAQTVGRLAQTDTVLDVILKASVLSDEARG